MYEYEVYSIRSKKTGKLLCIQGAIAWITERYAMDALLKKHLTKKNLRMN